MLLQLDSVLSFDESASFKCYMPFCGEQASGSNIEVSALSLVPFRVLKTVLGKVYDIFRFRNEKINTQ